MIRLQTQPFGTPDDVRAALQKAIQLEFATIPPYLYALYTLPEGANEPARARISAIVLEEMAHMALACNVLNAIGGSPVVADVSVVPTYPGPLPFEVGADDGAPLIVSLRPFSPDAIDQALRIEEPELPVDFPEGELLPPSFQTIGQFYAALDRALARLPAAAWVYPARHQLADHLYFPGDIFPVSCYAEASRAIHVIVSEGEGTSRSPLDFEGDMAHYYRLAEIRRDQVLQRDPGVPDGFRWGGRLGVDWNAVIPAIADPGEHDFSDDPVARKAQDRCDRAFTVMLREIQHAVNGEQNRLGNAVRAMHELARASHAALTVPLRDSSRAAGPAFRFLPDVA